VAQVTIEGFSNNFGEAPQTPHGYKFPAGIVPEQPDIPKMVQFALGVNLFVAAPLQSAGGTPREVKKALHSVP
jgi:hypothetical protein